MRKAFMLNEMEVVEVIDDASIEEHGEESLPTEEIRMNPWELEEDELEIENFFSSTGLTRNACLAHLLQLAIKDSAKLSRPVMDLAKKLSDVITFFNRSSHHYTKLKDRAGYSLVKPNATRWNSMFHGFKRLLKISKTSVRKHNLIPHHDVA